MKQRDIPWYTCVNIYGILLLSFIKVYLELFTMVCKGLQACKFKCSSNCPCVHVRLCLLDRPCVRWAPKFVHVVWLLIMSFVSKTLGRLRMRLCYVISCDFLAASRELKLLSTCTPSFVIMLLTMSEYIHNNEIHTKAIGYRTRRASPLDFSYCITREIMSLSHGCVMGEPHHIVPGFLNSSYEK